MSLKFSPVDVFEARHNAPSAEAQAAMLRTIGVESIEQLINETVPPAIRLKRALDALIAGGQVAGEGKRKARVYRPAT